MNGIASFVTSLDDPPKLKILIETLGFGHLHLDVTMPRVVIFREAILDMFAVELAEKFTSTARDAWTRLLNYVGGAIIFGKALVLFCVFAFLVVVIVFLLNMLVAQLTCAYEAVYVDMIGYNHCRHHASSGCKALGCFRWLTQA